MKLFKGQGEKKKLRLPFRRKAPQEGAPALPRKPRKTKRLVLLLVLLAVLAGGTAGVYALFFTEEEQVAVTGTTTYGTLNEALEGSGTTTPADSVTYTISGTVLEWYAETGEEVTEGDLLYVLDSSEVEDEMLEFELELEELYERYDELQDSVSAQQVTADFAGQVQEIQVEAGDTVQSGAILATLVDNQHLETTLYFSYAYEDGIAVGQSLTVSIPDQMLTLAGTVSAIDYVDYVTAEGMRCFAVTVEVENPGSLTEGVTATCWLEAADGTYIYAAADGTLQYRDEQTLTAGAAGDLTGVYVTNYETVTAGQLLFSIDASSYETQLQSVQEQIAYYEERIADLQESIETEYTRYADITGQIVYADYSTDRMTGEDSGTIMIYNQESMEITVNIDELNVDYLEEGMEVTVYRTTSSSAQPVYYPATLTYLSLEAGDYNETSVQILSGVEEGATVFLRYQNAAPSGGDTTSTSGDDESSGDFQMPSGGMGGGMPGGF